MSRVASEIWIFEMIFVVFRLMKNIIFNKTESFIGRNTSDHACQIFCFKSNWETTYHWSFLPEINMVKIMNNLNACSAHSQFKITSSLIIKLLYCKLYKHDQCPFKINKFYMILKWVKQNCSNVSIRYGCHYFQQTLTGA